MKAVMQTPHYPSLFLHASEAERTQPEVYTKQTRAVRVCTFLTSRVPWPRTAALRIGHLAVSEGKTQKQRRGEVAVVETPINL